MIKIRVNLKKNIQSREFIVISIDIYDRKTR